MKHIKILILLTYMLLPTISWSATPKIIPSQDLTYLGSFRLPTAPTGYSWNVTDGSSAGTTEITWDEENNVLIVPVSVASGSYLRRIMSFTPPAVGTLSSSKNINDLPQATKVSDPVNIALNSGGETLQQDGTYSWLGGLHYLEAKGTQATSKLYWSVYGGYVSSCAPFTLGNGMLGWAENNLAALSPKGVWAIEGCTEGTSDCCGEIGLNIFDAPQTWADTYTSGKSLIIGRCRSGGDGMGPTMYAVAPWEECGGTPQECDTDPPPDARDLQSPIGSSTAQPALDHVLPHIKLLGYTSGTEPGAGDWSPTNFVSGGAWLSVGSKRGIVFSGNQFLRGHENDLWSYSYSWWPYTESTGYHADPSGPVLWFYDQDDITAVAQGTKDPDEPQPYRRVELAPYFYNGPGYIGTPDSQGIGMAVDKNESGATIYFSEPYSGSYGSPRYYIVHVFTLADSGASSLDTTGPSTPIIKWNSRSKTEVSFSWDACTDDSGKQVSYRVYRNDAPIGVLPTTSLTTSYTDSYAAFFPPPVAYRVDAVDFEGNVTSSNVLTLDNAVDGNATLMIYVPLLTIATSAEHETSHIKAAPIGGSEYSVLVWCSGGTPPYVWTIADFPSGLSIDEEEDTSQARIHGSPGSGGSSNGRLTVEDSNGNTLMRKVIVSWTAAFNDMDNDGYTVAQGDTNDLNINVCPPLAPTQAEPSSLEIVGYGSNAISLLWEPPAQRTDITADNTNHPDPKRLQGELTYTIYYGSSSGSYTNSVFIGRGIHADEKITWTISNLDAGSYYIAVKATDFRGLISEDYSNEVSCTLGGNTNGQGYGTYYTDGEDTSPRIAETSDGGFVLGSWTHGYTWTSKPSDYSDEDTKVQRDGLLVKVNSSGTEQWKKVFDQSGEISSKRIGTGYYPYYVTGLVASGDDLIVAGTTNTGSEGYNISVLKFNSSGTRTLGWGGSFNSSSSNDDFSGNIIARTGGGWAVAAHGQGWMGARFIDSDGTSDTPGDSHMVAPPTGYWSECSDIAEDFSGNIYVVGNTYQLSTLDANGNPTVQDYFIVKMNSSGTIQWSGVGVQYDNSSRLDRAFSVVIDGDGDPWVFGRSTVYGAETTDVWVLELDPSDGSIQTNLTPYDADAGKAYVARGAILLGDDTFVVSGYQYTGTSYDGLVFNMNTSGTVVDSEVIDAFGAAPYSEDYLGKIVLSGSHYYAVGTSNGAFSTLYDLWFLKLATSDLSVSNATANTKTKLYYDKDLDGTGNANTWSEPYGIALSSITGFESSYSDSDDTTDDRITPSIMSGVTIGKGVTFK